MVISKINAYRNDLSRVIVYFEDRSYITVDAARASQLALKSGMEIDETLLPELSADSQKSAAKNKAARLIGRHSMSCATLLKKLKDRGIDEKSAQEALDWLIGLGAMNDEDYGRALISHYRMRGFGTRRIREELHHRGISREDIDALLCEEVDMQDAVLALIQKRAQGKELTEQLRAKITNALIRRGHSYETIRNAFSRYLEENGMQDGKE